MHHTISIRDHLSTKQPAENKENTTKNTTNQLQNTFLHPQTPFKKHFKTVFYTPNPTPSHLRSQVAPQPTRSSCPTAVRLRRCRRRSAAKAASELRNTWLVAGEEGCLVFWFFHVFSSVFKGFSVFFSSVFLGFF